MLNETAKRAVGEAWDTAITAIKQRLGPMHPAPVLAEQLRLAGDTESAAAPLRELLSTIQLGDDPEVRQAVQPLSLVLAQQGLALPAVQANTINGAGVVMGNQTNHFKG